MSTLSPMTLTTYEIAPSPGSRLAVEPRIATAPALATRSTVKRAMDLVGAIGGLIFLAPLLALVGLLVRLESRGPILFRQPRVGLNGRIFLCCKFRTMVPDAEQRLRDLEARNESAGGVLFKIKDDPRVTSLGRFLRKTSLDELPQLWNVLMGDMSLVGPRPLQLRDSEKLADVDHRGYSRRLTVVPGITGPWQVSGRSDIDSQQMLGLDLNYVTNWTLAVDLQILIKTISVVIVGKGAC
ncbi:sugar transferase (plasmid) [Tundrisphaera lichenicola]|uniref:sugar transferase n=1 Tax=Tundrisphaera lichenicola TaxID=2029860 RepID=UPI003EBE9C43